MTRSGLRPLALIYTGLVVVPAIAALLLFFSSCANPPVCQSRWTAATVAVPHVARSTIGYHLVSPLLNADRRNFSPKDAQRLCLSSRCIFSLPLAQVFLDLLHQTWSVEPQPHALCPEGAGVLARGDAPALVTAILPEAVCQDT